MATTAPPEVLDQICEYLTVQELKVARFTCQAFNRSARRRLFYQVRVFCDLESVRKVYHISQSTSLRNLVHKVILDGRIMPKLGFGDWKSCFGPGPQKTYEDSLKRKLWHSLCPPDIPWHFSQYQSLVESQKTVWEDDQILKWLSDACANLLQLEAISCGDDESMKPSSSRLFRIGGDCSANEQEWGMHIWHSRISLNQIDQLFQRLVKISGSMRKKLKAIEGYRLQNSTFDELEEQLNDDQAPFQIVRSLKLQYDFHLSNPNTTLSSFARFVSSMMMLRTLHLSFGAEYYPLRHMLTFRQHWPSLRDVRLSEMSAPQPVLAEFFETHASTLRRVKIANFVLEKPLQLAYTFEVSDTWLSIIRTLATTLHLSEICFDGDLLGAVDCWQVDGNATGVARGTPSTSASSPFLRDRIQSYIIHGGECPLDITDWPVCQHEDMSWKPRKLPFE